MRERQRDREKYDLVRPMKTEIDWNHDTVIEIGMTVRSRGRETQRD